MDKKEALSLLEQELDKFRDKPYSDLVQEIGSEPLCFELNSNNGNTYQLEFQIFWDEKPDGNIHVIGSIDNRGWRAFIPLTEDFIKSPADTFVGE